MNSVAITGIGLALSGMDSADDLLRAARRRSGDPLARLSRRDRRHKDRATALALAAARQALEDAGLDTGELSDADRERIGVVASTNYGNLDTVCSTVDAIAEHTYLGTSPVLLPSTASNVVASWLAITHGLRGANLTLCNGATSGLDAVHWARRLITAGRVDRVLVVGVEPSNEMVTGLAGGEAVDGAAALLLESASGVPRTSALVGGYARRVDPEQAVAAVLAAPGVGLWAVPEGGDPKVEPRHERLLDLGRLGRCSGALGVFQCVAGVAFLRAGGASVLATAGLGDVIGEDASAALIITGGAS